MKLEGTKLSGGFNVRNEGLRGLEVGQRPRVEESQGECPCEAAARRMLQDSFEKAPARALLGGL